MDPPDSPMRPTRTCTTVPRRYRRDGWTPARQLRFLDVLRRTRSVAAAARAVGMSRESAHRLRKRDAGGLFALTWESCFPPRVERSRAEIDKGHRLVIALACIPAARAPGASPPHRQQRDPGESVDFSNSSPPAHDRAPRRALPTAQPETR
ncbi:MAG TPA: hypothetical protein VM346_02570 [Sphingomicrobium sp.]|nr:hypothetical protein [Sphingomicrobium sp.]